MDATAASGTGSMRYWPEVKSEVLRWKFTPFEVKGKPVMARVEEYVDLVPPEKLPTIHVPPPAVRPESKVKIVLERSGCYGTCPSYTVAVSTDGRIVFDGYGYVVASGRYTDAVAPGAVRDLARKFVAADFYSMDAEYRALVTDNPTYVLCITIDGHQKKVVDYVGDWVGMPAAITDLEDEVDAFARTQRWITGSEGLVQSLSAEHFNFQSFEAQVILKGAATRGQTATVRELLKAGVPLRPIPGPKPKEPYMMVPFQYTGWLAAASRHLEALRVLLDAGASRTDQVDKDEALAEAASSGNVDAAKALIAYGANPNADLSKTVIPEPGGGAGTIYGEGAGSILIYAAQSGNPNVVRLILRYHPNLEARDREGKTAVFAAGEYRGEDDETGRVECVRLLALAGANVNARDKGGDTPLHEIFLTSVEAELLKLGANVNARNNDGETPIFTNVDDDSIPLFLAHGADLSIRDKAGETVMEAAKRQGPAREEALRKAIDNFEKR